MEAEMICWQNATRGEKKQFEAIAIFLTHSPHLVDFLFDPDSAKLNDIARAIASSRWWFAIR
jgi:hypothetical protein